VTNTQVNHAGGHGNLDLGGLGLLLLLLLLLLLSSLLALSGRSITRSRSSRSSSGRISLLFSTSLLVGLNLLALGLLLRGSGLGRRGLLLLRLSLDLSGGFKIEVNGNLGDAAKRVLDKIQPSDNVALGLDLLFGECLNGSLSSGVDNNIG
jgi:hypothetical protein